MNKKLYKIIFMDEDKKVQTLHASYVNPSSFLGLIEVSDIVFIDQSEIIISPEDGKMKELFKNVERTFIPLSHIIRIDEVTVKKETPVIRLYSETQTDS